MKSKLLPILWLVISTPLIAEVLISQNTPAAAFFRPAGIFWMVIGYGIPVLFIREVWKRKQRSLISLMILGIAYGILNEGAVAHTLTQTSGLPVGTFIGYGTVVGVNIGWATSILTWHALVSVTLPILLTECLFRREAEEPWLGNKLFVATGCVSALEYLFYFASGSAPATKPPMVFVIYIVVVVLLWVAANALGRSRREIHYSSDMFWPYIVGSAILPNIFYVTSFVLSRTHTISGWSYIALGWIFFSCLLYVVHDWTETRMLGCLIAFAATFSLIITTSHSDLASHLGAAAFAIFAGIIIRKVYKDAAKNITAVPYT